MKPLAPADLDLAYAQPKPIALAKAMDHVDRHAQRFIELSPFCVIGSSGPDGRQDVSPRGGGPGFIKVQDAKTLMLPDRPGNNRLDSLRNIASTREIGMLFLIPGVDETLRINGTAEIIQDLNLSAQFTEFGKPARSVMRIAVREVFLHCAKALMRSELWNPEVQVERSVLPSIAEMITDQLKLDRVAERHEEMVARYKESL